MDFYVIAASDENSDSVTLLKAEPLTVDEVNTYGTDANGVNHVNRYTFSSVGTAYDFNGYGGMAYYSSATCGNATVGGSYSSNGCESENATSYDTSDIKYVVDAWSSVKITSSDLTEDSLGYKTRLITHDELINNLEYTPSWVYNSKYRYWTMSPYNTSASRIWCVDYNGDVCNHKVSDYGNGVVRPVVTLLKSAL